VAEADLPAGSGIRLLERDVDVVAQVTAAGRRVAALLCRAARTAEEHIENIAETVGTERTETALAGAADPGVAEAIVVRTFLCV